MVALLLLTNSTVTNAVPETSLVVGGAPLYWEPGVDGNQHGMVRAEVFVGPDKDRPADELAIREQIGTYKVQELQVFEREDAWVATWIAPDDRAPSSAPRSVQRVRRWVKGDKLECSVAVPSAPGAAEWSEALCGEVKPMFLEDEGWVTGSGYGVPTFTGLLHQEKAFGKTLFTFNGSVVVGPEPSGAAATADELLERQIHPVVVVERESLEDGWIVLFERGGDYNVYARRVIEGQVWTCGDGLLDTPAHGRFTYEVCKTLRAAEP